MRLAKSGRKTATELAEQLLMSVPTLYRLYLQ
jgi:hypothetical protein